MIICPGEQGGQQWINARIGLPTASCFDKILTSKKLQASESQGGYIAKIVTEWLTGETLDPAVTDYIQRGADMEKEAVDFYDMERGVDSEPVGFIMRDDKLAGCSPDRMVPTQKGAVELKVPAAHTHVLYLLYGPGTDYRMQVQGQLWCMPEIEWVDFLSYHPNMPPYLQRFEREEEVQAALDTEMPKFHAKIDAAKRRLIALGCTQRERIAA